LKAIVERLPRSSAINAGSRAFSESSDPEDVMVLLRDYHAAIGEIIIKCSRTLER
jgi:hypothetical protein